MATREYKIRLPHDLPDVTSDVMAQWLDQALADGDSLRLKDDPGGGPARISLSLDEEKAVKFANARGEKVHIALRRLLASHAEIKAKEPEEKEVRFEGEVPERVLPRKLSYETEDFLDLIKGANKGMAFLYRRAYGLKDLKQAETPAEDRKLGEAMAEVANRRSTGWMIANADLVRLAFRSFRWSMAQTSDLDAQVREGKQEKSRRPAEATPTIDIPAPPATAEKPQPRAEEGVGPDAMVYERMGDPVQQEGQF